MHILPPILGFLWREPFSGFSFFRARSLRGLGFCMIVGFSSFSPFSCSFLQSLHFLSYRFAIPAMVLFDLSLLGLFGLAACSFLNDSVWSLGFLLHYLQVPVSYLFLLGHPWLIHFPWASLAFFLTLHSHGLLLTPLDFPGPITLSFILGAHVLAINPLLSLLALLRACCAHSHFSTSHIAHRFATSLSSGSFRPICLFHGPAIHYSCRLSLMVFLSIY